MNLPISWRQPQIDSDNSIQFAVLVTSLGWHGVSIREGNLVQLNPPSESADAVVRCMGREPDSHLEETNLVLLRRVEEQLNEYADGRRLTFDLPLALEGTKFQIAVWRHLMTIPAGRTATYQSVASAIGKLSRGPRRWKRSRRKSDSDNDSLSQSGQEQRLHRRLRRWQLGEGRAPRARATPRGRRLATANTVSVVVLTQPKTTGPTRELLQSSQDPLRRTH